MPDIWDLLWGPQIYAWQLTVKKCNDQLDYCQASFLGLSFTLFLGLSGTFFEIIRQLFYLIPRLFLGFKKEPNQANGGSFKALKGFFVLSKLIMCYGSQHSDDANHPFHVWNADVFSKTFLSSILKLPHPPGSRLEDPLHFQKRPGRPASLLRQEEGGSQEGAKVSFKLVANC